MAAPEPFSGGARQIKYDKAMYIIIWEYQVKADQLAEFERIYSPDGVWTKLFRRGQGFLRTELLRDERYPHRYITIDRWASSSDYESFLSKWKREYARLDAQCDGLMEKEALIGKCESIP